MPTIGNMSLVDDPTTANNLFTTVHNMLKAKGSAGVALTADRVLTSGTGTVIVNPDGITAANLATLSGQSVALSTQLAAKAGISTANTFTLLNTFNGGIATKFTKITDALPASPYVVTSTDVVIRIAAAAAVAVTLPAATDGRVLVFKDNGSAVTWNTTLTSKTSNGIETIDGAATLVINVNYASVTLVGEAGVGWHII